MGRNFTYGLLIFFIALLLMACEEDNPAIDAPVYLYNETIINPPDSFKILYNLRSTINYEANIRFEEDAVWKIEKLSSFTARFWVNRPDSTGTFLIVNANNLGLEGGINYYFYANNNNSEEDRKLYILFTKLDENYTSFEPKF